MFTFLLILQGIICFTLVALVLLHQGKGADAGAAFGSGGGAHSFFGAAGAADFMTKITTVVSVAFIACSIMLIREYPSAIATGGTTTGRVVDPTEGSRILQDPALQDAALEMETSAPIALDEATSPVEPTGVITSEGDNGATELDS